MRFADALRDIIVNDPLRWAALDAVRTLGLPDCWIGAGFVRDAIWDHLHGRLPAPPVGDVDVLWFALDSADADVDLAIETQLVTRHSGFAWSVKNQARMHKRNGDEPYPSVAAAMCAWPETATAVAVRRTMQDVLEINAPLGLADIFHLRLTPTARFIYEKREIFDDRVTRKAWLTRYPGLSLTV
jgi:hypothetical protein